MLVQRIIKTCKLFLQTHAKTTANSFTPAEHTSVHAKEKALYIGSPFPAMGTKTQHEGGATLSHTSTDNYYGFIVFLIFA